jgi:hypothetical protein
MFCGKVRVTSRPRCRGGLSVADQKNLRSLSTMTTLPIRVAFRRATGLPPRQNVLARRVDRAQ